MSSKIFKNKKIKIGILGGSFDPPHIGHLKISRFAIKKFNLDQLIWIITKKNPFKKKPYFNIKKRIFLSKKILNKNNKIKINFLEPKIKSNKTYAAINYLKKKNKNASLFFLMGADNLISFHKWHQWNKIPNKAKILVFDRNGYKTKAIKSIAAKKLKNNDWQFIKFKKVNISSSKINKN